MRFIYKSDISRAFFNWRFPLSIFLMYIVWELNSRRFQSKQDVLYVFIHVWGRSITYLMAVLVTSIPFLTAHIEDKEHYFYRYSLIRSTPKQYVFSKVFVAFTSAMSVFILGTSLFLLLQQSERPFVAEASNAVENFLPMTCLPNLLEKNPVLLVILQSLLYGCLCGCMCVLAMAFSAFIRNSLAIFMIPFLIYYVLYYLANQFLHDYPMLCIEGIYECIHCYTKDPWLFFLYAFAISFVFIASSILLMTHKIKEELK